jgi:MOSC domain-containing protein YiiM
MRVLQVRVGLIRLHRRDDGTEWATAIEKQPVNGDVVVHEFGLTGDEQADRKHHGGRDKAILAYARRHYAQWREEYGAAAPAEGTCGENLEVEGGDEGSVCIGDIYSNGAVTLQVSQPRQPCWKPAALHNLPNLTARILQSGRTGWYVRVLRGGLIAAQQEWALVARPNPEWTVSRASRVRHGKGEHAEKMALASLVELSQAWRDDLANLLGGGLASSL